MTKHKDDAIIFAIDFRWDQIFYMRELKDRSISHATSKGDEAISNGKTEDSCPYGEGEYRNAWIEGFSLPF